MNLQGIMKIVNFKGGLGNQVFQYLMCLYLKEKHPNERICGYYNPAFLKNHNGLEVQNVFDLELPNQTKWSTLVTLFARGASRIVKGLKAEDKTFHENAIYYDGWWQDKRFFLNNVNKLEFKDFCLDTINTQILNEIENKNSVSLHVRRGDYLTPKNKKIYAGICTLSYYQEAIKIVESNIESPHYFIFSNDMEWVEENLKIRNATYVTNNTGVNSYLDVYLMSHCKANIIANSSFSFWGAKLNKHQNQLVVYPKKWFHTHTPNIFSNEWYGI